MRITDRAELQRLADAYEAKYGSFWHFDVSDGGFGSGEMSAAVFRIEPSKVMAFAKEPHGQTTYRSPRRSAMNASSIGGSARRSAARFANVV